MHLNFFNKNFATKAAIVTLFLLLTDCGIICPLALASKGRNIHGACDSQAIVKWKQEVI